MTMFLEMTSFPVLLTFFFSFFCWASASFFILFSTLLMGFLEAPPIW
jgi:hypothetical protein